MANHGNVVADEKQLSGVVGFFSDAHTLTEAMKKVRDEKYKHFDAFTPYPVHGLEAAQGLKRSMIPFVTLGAGVTGTICAFLLEYWTSAIDWPLNVGGKPLNSWPAFVPIMFELTVLFAGLSTVGAMFLFNGLPNIKRRVFDPGLTRDRFAIWIGATLPIEDEDDEDSGRSARFKKFNTDEAQRLLQQVGAQEVRTVYARRVVLTMARKLARIARFTCAKRLVSLGLVASALTAGLTACRHEEPNTIYMPDMVYTKAIKAQRDAEAMRLPVKGTIPRGYHAYAYAAAKDAAEAGHLNTAPNPVLRTRANLLRGQKMFNTYCIVCHGPYGEGDGSIVPKFPRPPSLQSDKIRNYADQSIFHVITRGQNLMPSYASQISERDRWAIINYVRVLQKAKHPTPEDLKRVEQASAAGTPNSN